VRVFNYLAKSCKGCLAALILTSAAALTANAQEAAATSAATAPDSDTAAVIGAQITSLTSSLRSDNQSLDSTVRSVRQDIESKIDDGNAATAKNIASMHRAMNITAVSTALISLVGAIFSLIVLLRISRVASTATQATINTAASPQPTAQNPATAASLSRIEERLGALLAKGSMPKANAEAQAAAPKELHDKLNVIEAHLQNLTARKEATVSPAHASGGPDVSDAFWPKSLREQENYPIWRKSLASALAQESSEARQFATALLEFQSLSANRDADPEKYAEVVRRLGASVYKFCYTLETIPETDRLDAASALLRAVKDDARVHVPSLDIRAFFPNDRLNTDTMEKIDAGNRLTVSRPLSWLIIDSQGGHERILHRAQVITG
jgi:hypothetical protein